MNKITALVLCQVLISSEAWAIIADKGSKIGKGAYVAAIGGYSGNKLKFNKEIVPGSGIVSEELGSADAGIGIGYMGHYNQILLGVELVAGYATGSKTDQDNGAGVRSGRGARLIVVERNVFGQAIGKIGWKFGYAGAYVLGGFTRANFRVGTTNTVGGDFVKNTKFYQGPLFGVGLMYNLIEKFSPRFEFQRVKYRRTILPVVTPGLSVKTNSNIYYFAMVYHLQ